MKKRALVVAGGQWQVPLINYLKEKNFFVTVVDPYTSSKGVIVADSHIQEDVREKEKIFSKIDTKYDIVCTDQSDISVGTVAFLADKLHLKGNKEDVILRFTNKYLSRKYAESIGVPVPAYTEVSTLEDINQFIDKVEFPLILKPCDAQSSKGIHKIDTGVRQSDLTDYLVDALQYSFIKKAILEQFVTGYEITVEGFCSQGEHRVLAISKKKHFKTGIASTLTYPAPLPLDLEERIIEVDNRYVDESGLKFGPTHAEYIVDENKGEFYLVEIACRGGGTLISSDIVKWVSGFDVYEAYLNCLQNNDVQLPNNLPQKRAAELHFFDFGSGIVDSVSGIEAAGKIDGVLSVDIDIKEGDVIESCRDDRSRQGFAIIFADNEKELNSRVSKVCDTIKVNIKR